MARKRYVVLLRGINVGGRNPISMADLRDSFEARGFEKVSTYIQSGNVLLSSAAKRASLEGDIQRMLQRRLGLDLVVVVRSDIQMRNIVGKAPQGFGEDPDRYHFDVVYLKHPLTPDRALRVVDVREGVDRVWPGTGVLYFSRLSERRSQSRLSRLTGTPEYELMTIRNWNTTTRLVELLDG
jgi:uncharacterized protein (DUF1697 family)